MINIAQKTIGGLMLLIFVLSLIPAALAEMAINGVPGDNNVNTSTGIPTQEILDAAASETAAEIVTREASAQTAGETTVTSTSGIMEKQVNDDSDLKNKYLEEKEKYQTDKEELQSLKMQLRDCKEAINASGCQLKKLELKKGVQIHLVKTITLIEKSFARLTHRVETSKVLTEEEKTEALAKIAELEQQLTVKEQEIKALDAAALTNTEMQKEVKELKALWNDVRTTQRRIITELINSRHQKMVEMYSRFVDRVDTQIQKLQAQSSKAEDVAKLNELLVALKAKVAEVQSAHTAARQSWLNAKTEHTAEAIDAAHQVQEQVRAKMKEAKAALRELLQELKTIQASLKTAGKVPQPVAQ